MFSQNNETTFMEIMKKDNMSTLSGQFPSF